MSNPNLDELPARRQPETLRLRTLTPAMTVSDLDRSLAWYCDTVGFVVVQKWEEDGRIAGAILEAGRIRIFLVQAGERIGTAADQTLRLYCSTAQDIDELAATIESRGGTLDQRPTDQAWGARTFDIIDPDGVRLTVSSVEQEGSS
jgi:uncharacterized glyoxalase superfamily protein PhnB